METKTSVEMKMKTRVEMKMNIRVEVKIKKIKTMIMTKRMSQHPKLYVEILPAIVSHRPMAHIRPNDANDIFFIYFL